MPKSRILIILIFLVILGFAVRAAYFRFIKTYEAGKDPTLYEITRAYCMTESYSSDYGYNYEKYSVNSRDKKYYAETDIFDRENKKQEVKKLEITGAEYREILKLIEGCQYVRHVSPDPGAMDGFMDSSSFSADITWPGRPDGAWELSMDPDVRRDFSEAVKNAVVTMNILFISDAGPSSVWILRDTAENRKTSVWGTAMIKPSGSGKEYSADIPYSADNKYLFRMIDEDGLYYDTDIPELLEGWQLHLCKAKNGMYEMLKVLDDKGELRYECEVFCAAL